MAKNPNQAKTAIMVAAAVALVAAAGILLRSSRSSSTPPSRQSGSSLIAVATDKNGNEWFLEMASGPSLAVSGDGSTKSGAPLLVKTNVQIAGRDVSIGLIIEGQAGETYIPAAHRNAQRLPAPGLKIVDEAGKTLATGQFQYG